MGGWNAGPKGPNQSSIDSRNLDWKIREDESFSRGEIYSGEDGKKHINVEIAYRGKNLTMDFVWDQTTWLASKVRGGKVRKPLFELIMTDVKKEFFRDMGVTYSMSSIYSKKGKPHIDVKIEYRGENTTIDFAWDSSTQHVVKRKNNESYIPESLFNTIVFDVKNEFRKNEAA